MNSLCGQKEVSLCCMIKYISRIMIETGHLGNRGGGERCIQECGGETRRTETARNT